MDKNVGLVHVVIKSEYLWLFHLVDAAVFSISLWLKSASGCALTFFKLLLTVAITNKTLNDNYCPVTLTSFAQMTDGSQCVVTSVRVTVDVFVVKLISGLPLLRADSKSTP